jgi:fucose 4-O-acetylase-like acetyltransferase
MPGSEDAISRRWVWLDVAKGVGIVLVVIAHIADNSSLPGAPAVFGVLSLFFMPLFFVISGFLYAPRERAPFIRRRLQTLALPYVLFLGAVMVAIIAVETLRGDLPELWQLRQRVVDAILGGRYLVREFGILWFVSCLFFTQIVYNEVALRARGPGDPRVVAFAAAAVGLAYLMQFLWPDNRSPLALAQVPLAIGAFWFGQLLRHRGFALLPSLGFVGGVLAAALVGYGLGADFTFSMKNGVYGPPLLGFVLALALSLGVLLAVRSIESIRTLSAPFAALGEASLVIMFLHQFVHFTLRDAGVSNEVILLALSVGVPYAVYLCLERSEVLSPWFLGRGELTTSLHRIARGFVPRS